MKSNRVSFGKNIRAFSSLNHVDSWSDLNQLTPMDNDEVFVNNVSGTMSGKVIAKYVNKKWIVPGADLNTIEYTNKTYPIKTSISTPKNIEFFGKNAEFESAPISINELTYNVGNESSACTFSVNITNFSNKTVKAIKFVIHIMSNNNCTYYGKFKINKGARNDWKYITWSGIDHIKPTNQNQTMLNPTILVSDFIQIPEKYYSGHSITLYISCVGNTEEVVIPRNNNSFYFPMMFASENFGVGNFSLSGTNESWSNINQGHPVSHLIYEYEDPTPITSIITIGDSTFSEDAPLATPVGNGWCQHTNNNCRTSGLDWRINSLAQGGYGNLQFIERLKSILSSDLKNYIDVIAYQSWSGNSVPNNISEYNQFLDVISEAKSLCTSANISFFTMCIYPAVIGEYLVSPDTSAYGMQKLAYYNNMKTYVSANYNYLDISYCVTDETGLDYNVEDSFDGSHANVGSYENRVGQYKQAIAIMAPMKDMMRTLKYNS